MLIPQAFIYLLVDFYFIFCFKLNDWFLQLFVYM